MGAFLSCCEGNNEDRCHHCTRRAVNGISVINNVCEICRSHYTRRIHPVTTTIALRPLFGEYKCVCGRRWNSRKSWYRRFQICEACRREVQPHTQRELRDSDISRNRENLKDHNQELCQMCMELGYYCGKLRFTTIAG